MCTYPVQPICTFSCTSVFFINIYYPQYIVLHILSHRTSYSFYCIICSLFHSHLYLYIYSLVLCFIVSLLMLFLFYFLFLFFLHFPLSGPVLTYISLLIIYTLYDCVCDKNKEPWTLNQWPAVCFLVAVFQLNSFICIPMSTGTLILLKLEALQWVPNYSGLIAH